VTVTSDLSRLHSGQFLPDLLVAALNRHPDRPAVYLGDDVLTGRQVAEQMSCYKQAYTGLGIGQGSPIAMISPNRPEVLFAMGANMLTGCRASALHPLGSLDDHAYVVEDAELETLVFDPSFAERAQQLQERCPKLKRLLSLGPCDVGEDLLALAGKYSPEPLVPPEVKADDVAGLAYTGGTTGKPKGVMGTYRSGAMMTQIQLLEWDWPADTRFLICTPLSHAGAAFFIPTLMTGGALVVLPYFEPGLFLETIEKHKITATMLVPTMLYVLLDHPKLNEVDTSSLQTVYYGAAACSPTRLQEAIRRLGPIFFQYYGQAECPMAITSLRKEDHDVDDLERLATCGRPTPWIRVALLDDDNNPVPRGEPGEICCQGPLVMAGYWKKPAETEEALRGGWLHTGDIAREDAHGFYTIVDRKKDMIVSGGFNVFPREVEDVLGTHAAVAQCAVIGVPDEKWGEAVKAIVVLRPDASVEEAELIAMVKDAKGAHYAPKTVEFAESIPISPLGKPDKKALRAIYWGDTGRQVN
jgi:fatty-acyl-CoA synthase